MRNDNRIVIDWFLTRTKDDPWEEDERKESGLLEDDDDEFVDGG